MMTGELIILIGLAFFFLILVFALFWYFKSNQKAGSDSQPAASQLPNREAASVNTSLKPGSYQEIALLQRDLETGRLVIAMNNARFSDPKLIDEAKRLELQRAAKELFLWLNVSTDSQAVPQDSAPAERRVEPRAPMVPPAIISEKDQDKLPAGTIVEQIDAILQNHISSSPDAFPPIKVVEDARRGVIVWVGLKSFEGIDSVPDSNIRALLHKAVSEWERRDELQRRKKP